VLGACGGAESAGSTVADVGSGGGGGSANERGSDSGDFVVGSDVIGELPGVFGAGRWEGDFLGAGSAPSGTPSGVLTMGSHGDGFELAEPAVFCPPSEALSGCGNAVSEMISSEAVEVRCGSVGAGPDGGAVGAA
jgi:hypothetical protein